MIAGVFVLAPCNGYFLDRLGFGFVLLLINVLCLGTAVLQSIPVLKLQVCCCIASVLGVCTWRRLQCQVHLATRLRVCSVSAV